MAIERRLTEIAGPVGGKLHTARSRNDQVATDVALFTRDAARAAATRDQRASCARSSRSPSATSTGRCPATRTSSAPSPSTSRHHLLAYFWMLVRDRARFRFVAEQTASLPLGAGALAGVNFETDRAMVARELGFAAGPAPNSIDAVSNRDFVLDYLSAAATCATHLSRLGAELVLWSTRGVRLRRAARRLVERLVDHAPEEEPRRGRAAAREGAADRRAPERAARRDARPPADLQQGHAGGQGAPLRRGRHARAVPRRRARDDRRRALPAASGSPPPRRTSSSPRPTSPTCSSSAACRSASRTASSPASCAPRSTPAARSPQLSADELRAASEQLDHGEVAGVLAQQSWLESKVSEGGTALERVREQLEAARAELQ